jgi:hypothetical protein
MKDAVPWDKSDDPEELNTALTHPHGKKRKTQ